MYIPLTFQLITPSLTLLLPPPPKQLHHSSNTTNSISFIQTNKTYISLSPPPVSWNPVLSISPPANNTHQSSTITVLHKILPFCSDYLYLRLSISQTIYISDYLYLRLSISQTIYISDYLYLRLSISQTIYISDYLYLRLSISQTIYISDYLYLRLSIFQNINQASHHMASYACMFQNAGLHLPF